jgi:hemerythrin-like domain-containing protein
MIQIGQKSSPTFRQPLELLSDCHRRVESFLRDLILVTDEADGGHLSEKQREALETALRYFREAAPRHTADEEDSLFPRLRQVNDPAVLSALEKINRLEADHKIAKTDHDSCERLGQKWLAEGRINSTEAASLRGALKHLHEIYECHIALEDEEIFPLAGKHLDCKTLKTIGSEMANRRGQNLG